MTYHFRNVPVEKREPLVHRARELITGAGFNIGNAHCALEVGNKVSYLIENLSILEQTAGSLGQRQGEHLYFEDSFWS